jgi:formylglycine-generating enzyme required for sulfatase activity
MRRARRLTDRIFDLVPENLWLERPIPERHRMLFYLGHLEAFDWNLGQRFAKQKSTEPRLDRLFAFGIDPPMGEMPRDLPSDWPTYRQTLQYSRRTRQNVDTLLAHAPPSMLHMMIEHRLMHAETFTYILHNLREPLLGLATPQSALEPAPQPAFIRIPEGEAVLGRTVSTRFGWDNEFGEVRASVPEFAIGKYKVTNADYLQFVNAGGPVPFYWRRNGDAWLYRGLSSLYPLPHSWPVYVTHQQAAAFAAWLGKSLPTEAQFHRAAFGNADNETVHYPWGTAEPTPAHGNFSFFSGDLAPVNTAPLGDSRFGVSQLVGNGWEWTSTPFEPFPGFQASPDYAGYSQPFFDGAHYVLKGGSCGTDRALLRSSFRNWFRFDYPYAYTTFRLVEN